MRPCSRIIGVAEIRSLLFIFVAALVAVTSLSCAAVPNRSDSNGSDIVNTSTNPERTVNAENSRPPESTLSYGDVKINGTLGSYCWTTIIGKNEASDQCADVADVVVGEEALIVPARSTMKFVYGGEKLDSVSVTAESFGRGNPLERAAEDKVLVPNDSNTKYEPPSELKTNRTGTHARIRADLPEGEYALVVFAMMPEGDVSYGFRVVVEETEDLPSTGGLQFPDSPR